MGGQQRLAPHGTNADLRSGLATAITQFMSQLGKAAIKKPAQQRRSLCIVYRIMVIAERLLHPWPVRHVSTAFGQCQADFGDEHAPSPRVRSHRYKARDLIVQRS